MQKSSVTGTADQSDQRSAERNRVLKGGIVCFNGRHSTIPCTVRNISDTGALLQAEGSVNVPDTFELHIELDGIWVDCEVVFRRDDQVGIKFTSEKTCVPPSRKQTINALGPDAKASLRRKPIR